MGIRSWLYRNGFRPGPGSIFYSPSLSMIYSIEESMRLNREWHRGYRQGVKDLEVRIKIRLDGGSSDG